MLMVRSIAPRSFEIRMVLAAHTAQRAQRHNSDGEVWHRDRCSYGCGDPMKDSVAPPVLVCDRVGECRGAAFFL